MVLGMQWERDMWREYSVDERSFGSVSVIRV